MKLPNLEHITIPPEKLTKYLLNTEHDQGGGKALFFIHMGFLPEQWNVLAEALIRHAHEHEVVKTEPTPFGTRYIVEGMFQTPGGRIVQLRSVWFIENDQFDLRLVTAYPLED